MARRLLVWDKTRKRRSQRDDGERTAGAFHIIPILFEEEHTSHGANDPKNVGNLTFDAGDYDIFSAKFCVFVSHTKSSGLGYVQLYNFTSAVEICRIAVNGGDLNTYRESTIALPSVTGQYLIGIRLWRETGGGKVGIDAAAIKLLER